MSIPPSPHPKLLADVDPLKVISHFSGEAWSRRGLDVAIVLKLVTVNR